MKNLIKYSSVLLLGLMIFSSCSKQKYTASFAPSKSKTWNKVEAPAITKNAVVNEKEAVVTIKEETAALVVEKSIVKPAKISEEVAKEEAIKPAFTKAETKQMKKDVRKAVVKSVFKKKKSGDINILAVILSLFPILCLIGVWLHHGQTINNDFWLDLVLHLTVIGEVIYALLVTLGIFSIA